MELLAEGIEFPNKLSSFQRAVNSHRVIRLESIAQMLNLRHPRKRISIEEYRGNIPQVNILSFVFDLDGSGLVLNFRLFFRANSSQILISCCNPDLLPDRSKRSSAYPKQEKKTLVMWHPRPEFLRIFRRS
jgi:hypothetical protein